MGKIFVSLQRERHHPSGLVGGMKSERAVRLIPMPLVDVPQQMIPSTRRSMTMSLSRFAKTSKETVFTYTGSRSSFTESIQSFCVPALSYCPKFLCWIGCGKICECYYLSSWLACPGHRVQSPTTYLKQCGDVR